MKIIKLIPVVGICVLLTNCSSAQMRFNKKSLPNLNQVTKVADAIKTGGTTTGLSSEDIIAGLKEALSVGSYNVTSAVSSLDGFNKNDLIRLPFPPEAIKMKEKLIAIGMQSQVDKFEETLNRAAEKASQKAAPIFISAITEMTFGDGMSILKGENNAATTN